MGHYLASLQKLMGRDDRIFYPTHGSPIASPRDWLVQMIEHRHMRERQILELLRGQTGTIFALVEKLYPDIPRALRPAAAQQVKAHLEHSIERGLVARDGESYSLK
jgi:glyoxylase-like metal-dependent hydrolase (beta-lactamase superfamily II)